MSDSILRHLAIIPDGNRRWAKSHGITAEVAMYRRGSEKITEVVEAALDLGITYVSLWASSYSNLTNRPKALVAAIDKIFEKKFLELSEHPRVFEEGIKIDVVGEWRDLMRPATIAAAEKAMAVTTTHSKRFLTILIGYDGHRERGTAVQSLLAVPPKIPQDVQAAEHLLRGHAWTGHLPDVDLVVRTGAAEDPHNSAAFLSFLTGESQYAFPSVLWPDFDRTALKAICDDFVRRERRFGK